MKQESVRGVALGRRGLLRLAAVGAAAGAITRVSGRAANAAPVAAMTETGSKAAATTSLTATISDPTLYVVNDATTGGTRAGVIGVVSGGGSYGSRCGRRASPATGAP